MRKLHYLFSALAVFLVCSFGVKAASKTIDDGIYTISSAINQNYVLDVASGSMQNGANIQLYKDNYINSQQWKVTYLGNGYYSIASVKNTSFALSVAGGKKTNGANIQLWTYNKTSAAYQWTIKSAGNGYYYVVSKSGGKYMSARAGKAANKTNIQTWTGSNKKAYKFAFTPVEKGKKTIADGVYTISSALNTDYVIDAQGGNTKNGTNIQLYKGNNTAGQQWKVSYLGNGYYSMVSAKNNKFALSVSGANKANGTNIQLWTYNKTGAAYQWIIKDAGDGYYYVISKSGGKYMSVRAGKAANNSNIQTWTGSNSKTYKFVFSPVVKGTQTIDDGTYIMSTKLSDNMVVEFDNDCNSECGNGPLNGTNIQLDKFTNEYNQQWYVEYLNNGYYKIETRYGSDSFTLEGKKKVRGTNVQLWSTNNHDAQQWVIKDAGDGYYYVISKNSGLALDIDGGEAKDNANIYTWNSNNSDSQKIKFTPTVDFSTSPQVTTEYVEEENSYKVSVRYLAAFEGDEPPEPEFDGIELYSSDDENGQYTKVDFEDDYYIHVPSNPGIPTYYKARVYKNTVNGKAYSYYSEISAVNALKSKLITNKTNETSDTVTYSIGLDVPSIPFFHDFIEDKNPTLEIEHLSLDSWDWEPYTTENGFTTTMTFDKNMDFMQALNYYYRMRIVYTENGVQKRSEYIQFNPHEIYLTTPSFDMNVDTQNNEDGTADYTFSIPKDFENVNYMKLYEVNEEDEINESEPIYEGEELSYTLHVEDDMNKRYQMYLYNREDVEDGYSMELLKVSSIYEVDYRYPTVKMFNFIVDNDEEMKQYYSFNIKGLSNMPLEATHAELFAINVNDESEYSLDTFMNLNDLNDYVDIDSPIHLYVNEYTFENTKIYKLALKLYDNNNEVIDTIYSNELDYNE